MIASLIANTTPPTAIATKAEELQEPNHNDHNNNTTADTTEVNAISTSAAKGRGDELSNLETITTMATRTNNEVEDENNDIIKTHRSSYDDDDDDAAAADPPVDFQASNDLRRVEFSSWGTPSCQPPFDTMTVVTRVPPPPHATAPPYRAVSTDTMISDLTTPSSLTMAADFKGKNFYQIPTHSGVTGGPDDDDDDDDHVAKLFERTPPTAIIKSSNTQTLQEHSKLPTLTKEDKNAKHCPWPRLGQEMEEVVKKATVVVDADPIVKEEAQVNSMKLQEDQHQKPPPPPPPPPPRRSTLSSSSCPEPDPQEDKDRDSDKRVLVGVPPVTTRKDRKPPPPPTMSTNCPPPPPPLLSRHGDRHMDIYSSIQPMPTRSAHSASTSSSVGAIAIHGPASAATGSTTARGGLPEDASRTVLDLEDGSGLCEYEQADTLHHDPYDSHQQNLIEATLVEDHPTSTPVLSSPPRPTPEDLMEGDDDASNFSLGATPSQISLMPTDTFVEAKPISRIKPLLLMCLVLAAIVAIFVGVTLSVNSSFNSKDDNDNDGSSTPIIPPSRADDDTGMNANTTTTTTTVYDSTPSSSSSSSPTPSPTATPMPTLQRIRTEGVLRCGVLLEKFSNLFAKVPGKENTFESDICRAIAAAVMGRDKYKIEIVPFHMAERVDAIESGEIDVLLAGLSWTMDRDVRRGLGFSVYTTLSTGFGGIPEYVACAQDGLNYQDECAGLKICTINGTRFYDNLAHQVPRGMLQIVERYEDYLPAFQEGTCNVFASTFIDLNFMTLQLTSTPGAGDSFSSGQGYFSSEPLGIVTREGDYQWRDFCSYIMQSLFAAEYHNITRENALSLQEEDATSGHPKFRRPTVFGQAYKDMFIDAVATSGNYGEMETRRVNPIMLSREPINYVNNGTTGIIHSLPFGDRRTEGPSLDEQFEDIFSRGKLRCAIKTFDRPGFAQRSGSSSGLRSYSGMDVDYCLAIAASMFGPLDTVEFFEVKDDSEGLGLLHRGEVDVVAGVMGDMERDVMDPETGVGFSFTTPYFYNSTADGTQRGPDANLCLATREDLTGWSEFVFWIVQATFFAEEQAITRLKANDMPRVEFYGERFTRIFRDAISAVGGYGEIYERNVEEHFPRGGLNMLHDKSNPTPLFYVSPGIFQ